MKYYFDYLNKYNVEYLEFSNKFKKDNKKNYYIFDQLIF